jgi:hypothetical protein
MPDQTAKPVSTTDYAGSLAPETQEEAHGRRERDMRMIPGGGHDPATLAVGMESLDRGESVSTNLEQTDYRESREDDAAPRRHGQS